MEYTPFQKYFELGDMYSDLRSLMVNGNSNGLDVSARSTSCSSDEFENNDSGYLRLSLFGEFESFDPLDRMDTDMIREDFRNNGVDVEMDEVDQLQQRLRSAEPSVQNPVLNQYIEMRERRKSKGKSLGKRKAAKTICVFCKNNGEQLSVYCSHVLKDERGRVTCPVLRKYTCPLCHVSGDAAHTIRYCPRNSENNAASLGVLMSPHLSTGKLNPRATQ